MGLVERYEIGLNKLLNDKLICKENRDLFKKFFEAEEYKLKRKRKLTKLNDKVLKTLVGYLARLYNVNLWFKNKPWKDLTKADIKKVYDDLEDEKVLNSRGTPFKDKISYYNKIMKSTPFRMVGKDQIAREVIVTTVEPDERDAEVRFITEEDFQKAMSLVIQVKHKLALQLAWDIGENMSTILELCAKDCVRKMDEDTKEPYFNIRLRKEFLKTGRRARTEPTLQDETYNLLDIHLQGKDPEDKLFDIAKPQMEKVFRRVVGLSGIRCQPDGQIPTIKDIRSGMACHLLDKDWTTDEIKSRLGHAPSSTVIDRYVNYKAKKKDRSRKKIKSFEIQKLKDEIKNLQDGARLHGRRMKAVIDENKEMYSIVEEFMREVKKIKTALKKKKILL